MPEVSYNHTKKAANTGLTGETRGMTVDFRKSVILKKQFNQTCKLPVLLELLHNVVAVLLQSQPLFWQTYDRMIHDGMTLTTNSKALICCNNTSSKL